MHKTNKMKLARTTTKPAYVNDVDAWTPERWANETLAILTENMVIAGLVHREFSNIVAENGDIVNTRKPGEYTTTRKGVNTDIATQSTTDTNIQVKLNQHLYNSFIIKDRENALAFQDLVDVHLNPAALSIAQTVDRILLAQAIRFLPTTTAVAGQLGVDASVASILNTRRYMNDVKCPMGNRNFIISSKDETALLALDTFINADKVGDQGTALREASLGRRLGFNFYMCQNVMSVTSATDSITAAVNNGAGYAAGTTVLVVDGITGALETGSWLKIAGDLIPQRITAHTETTGNTTGVTITPGLKSAVVDNAVITVSDTWLVNLTAGYVADWEEPIVIDGFTIAPQVGQFVQFIAGGSKYVIIGYNSTTSAILLDRPLEAAIANNAVIYVGPVGTYNFAFVRDAMTMVSRPMALPRAGTGSAGAIANYGGISLRVTQSYDYTKQGTVCTVDTLFGVQVLEEDKGAVMLG